MWYKHRFFKYMLGLLLILLNIYFLGRIDFFLVPLRNVLGTIFFPLLISGLLYYLLRPLVNLLVRLRIPRSLSILILFVLLLALLAFLSASAGSMLVSQASQLYNNAQNYIHISTEKTVEFFNSGSLSFIPAEQLQQQLTGFLGKLVPILSQSIISGIAAVANFATVLVIVPFILFYLLKDDHIFHKHLLSLIPKKHRDHGDDILDDIDKTLSVYIIGQAIMALTVGLLMYIGYLILGLDFALLLAIFALVTAFIPILGAFIGVIPAILVGLTVNPLMALKVLILMIIVQQLEGNLLSPQIMGKRMNIHPLTFIIILLAAASLAGFIGMLIAVPVYAVIKVIGKKIYEIYKLDKKNA
jgi:predicted PurR-regulated permease PerM